MSLYTSNTNGINTNIGVVGFFKENHNEALTTKSVIHFTLCKYLHYTYDNRNIIKNVMTSE